MRRANKIIMVTVAILLSLVLFSTSLVSGIFAKFVVQKSGQTTIGLERFGVSVKLTPRPDLKSTEEVISQAGDTVSVKFKSNLALDQFVYNALKVEVTGTPNVNVKFRMACKVEFNTTQFKVDNNSIYGDVAKNKSYMPLGFTVGFTENDGEITDWEYVCRPYQIPSSTNHIDEIITRNIADKVCGITYNKSQDPKTPYDSSTESYYLEKTFTEEISGPIECFYLGFDWLSTGRHGSNVYPTPDEDINNLVATHLAEKAAGSYITLTYTFHLEQTS